MVERARKSKEPRFAGDCEDPAELVLIADLSGPQTSFREKQKNGVISPNRVVLTSTNRSRPSSSYERMS